MLRLINIVHLVFPGQWKPTHIDVVFPQLQRALCPLYSRDFIQLHEVYIRYFLLFCALPPCVQRRACPNLISGYRIAEGMLSARQVVGDRAGAADICLG